MTDVLSRSVPVLISPLLTRKEIASKTYGKQRYQVPLFQKPLMPAPPVEKEDPYQLDRSSVPHPLMRSPSIASPRSPPPVRYRVTRASSPCLSPQPSPPTGYPVISSPRLSARSVSPPMGYHVMRTPRLSGTMSPRVSAPVKMRTSSPSPLWTSVKTYDEKPVLPTESDTTSEPKSLMDTISSLASSKAESASAPASEEAEWDEVKIEVEVASSKVDLLQAFEEAAREDAKADFDPADLIVKALSQDVLVATAPETSNLKLEAAQKQDATDTDQSDVAGERALTDSSSVELESTPTEDATPTGKRSLGDLEQTWDKVEWGCH